MRKRVKTYIHETQNEVTTLQLRNNRLLEHPEQFTGIVDIKGNPVPVSQIKRSNEMTGAGIEYLTCFVDTICTHFNEYIDATDQYYYTSPEIPWDDALKIMTGGVKNQNMRAETAIMHYMKHPKQILCLCVDGCYRSAQPFVVIFNWGTKKELEKKVIAKFSNLKNTGTKAELMPIKTVSIQFYKPLFQAFFNQKACIYSFPTGMYAKIYEQAEKLRLNDDDMDTRTTAFARFARHIIQHQNLTGHEKPDANGLIGRITIETIELIRDADPSLVKKNGHGTPVINWLNFTAFLTAAQCTFWNIPNFICYPVFDYGTERQDFIDVYLYKTGTAAKKAAGL
jgi:hypothetical protein